MKNTFSLLLLLLSFGALNAQQDSIIFTNEDVMVGELKEMDHGVATFKTSYSDSDFKIEWSGVREIYTQSGFLITFSDGRRFNGRLESNAAGKVRVLAEEGEVVERELHEVVFLKSVDQDFASRLSASIDVGFSITKAQNLQQLTINSNLGYLAERWFGNASYRVIRSTQDNVETTQRTDSEVTFRYFLPRDWFALSQVTFLSNTEQKLALRTNGKLGAGKFVIHTNQTYWGFQGGASFNNENFSDDSPDRRSMEAFLGTELNLYDIGDLDLLSRAVIYRGVTEAKRWRSDLSFDAKYDLPLDFYIRASFTLNYDNQPVEGASQADFAFQTALGWEW